MSYPRKFATVTALGEPLSPTLDWDTMVDRINGFTPAGTFVSPYSYLITKTTDGGVDYYCASNAFQPVYGGSSTATHHGGGVDGTDLAAVVQAAINAGSTVIFGEGTFTFTVAKYSPGEATHKIGVYLKDNVHIIIMKGAYITQAANLKLEVFFAGHLWGTGGGTNLTGVTFEVYGMIDCNYGAQGYVTPTDFQGCPLALYATKCSFPMIQAKEFGRYGALVLYGSYNHVGKIYAENSYDTVNHQAPALDLERCEETTIEGVIASQLDGRGVQMTDGGNSIAIGSINTYNCYGNLLIAVASALAIKGVSVGQIVSGGHYTSGGYGGILITPADGLGGISDISFGSVIINGASDDGIKIANLGTPHTALVRRVTIGSAILCNNHQHGGDGGLALAHCDNVTIGFLHAYDDQGVKTQYWGVKLGDEVSSLLINGGSVAGNVDTVDGYTTAKGKILNVVAFLTMNHGATTGTGAQQTIAHGLGATPSYVRFWDYAGDDEADAHLNAASDAANFYPLAVLNKIYLWEAYI
jgi:hypothetical protein